MVIHIYSFRNTLNKSPVENSCQLMSKEFSNDKRITNKHDKKENLVKDKGIPKSDCRSMAG